MQEKEIIKCERIKVPKSLILVSIIMTVFGWGLGEFFQVNAMYDYLFVSYIGLIGLIMLIPIGFIALYSRDTNLVITNKRVYGVTFFGTKRLDLPIDSISAVGTSFLNGVYIGTSSGKILFILIKNNNEIHKEISQLLMNRQNNKNNDSNISMNIPDELKKYKELLDMDAITQDEYDKKKKEILKL